MQLQMQRYRVDDVLLCITNYTAKFGMMETSQVINENNFSETSISQCCCMRISVNKGA